MKPLREVTTKSLWVALGLVTMVAAAGCAMSPTRAGLAPVRLTGAQEVPPVGGNASGSTDIRIALATCRGGASARCPQAQGTVTTTGFTGTAAHIHRGKPGQNGPVILPLVKTGDNTWGVPDGAYISESDFGAYNDGDLYVNVHSANNPNGEVRGQLVP